MPRLSTWATWASSVPCRAVPGWPGAGVYPPQPMVGQMRDVLDTYRAAGGRHEEHVLAGCGHSPHPERPQEFDALVAGFLAGV